MWDRKDFSEENYGNLIVQHKQGFHEQLSLKNYNSIKKLWVIQVITQNSQNQLCIHF